MSVKINFSATQHPADAVKFRMQKNNVLCYCEVSLKTSLQIQQPVMSFNIFFYPEQ